MDSIITEKRAFSRQDVANLLIGANALSELDSDSARTIVSYMKAKRIAATQIVVQEGFTNTGFMALVLQGDAVVENELNKRTDSLVISTLGVGALIGELGLIDAQPRSATVRAITPMDIAVLERSALAQIMRDHPLVACKLLSAMLSSVSDRLRATNRKLMSMHRINRSMQEEFKSNSVFQNIEND